MKTIVRDDHEGLSFIIPSSRQWIAVLFLLWGLVGWFFGGISGLGQLWTGSDPSFLPWLTVWAAFGAFVWYIWLWMVVGKEKVILRPGFLILRDEIFGLGRSRQYDLGNVRHLRVAPRSFIPRVFRGGFRGFGSDGGITFDYGGKTIRFGTSLDEAEGGMIVHRIRARHAIAD